MTSYQQIPEANDMENTFKQKTTSSTRYAAMDALDVQEEYDNDRLAAQKSRPKFFKVVHYTTIGLAWILAFFQGYLIGHITYTLARTPHFDEGTKDFALYKNSRFQQCLRSNVSSRSCSAITPVSPATGGTINAAGFQGLDWCSAIGCLQNYTIVPTYPKDSAFDYTGLDVVFWYNLTCLLAWFSISQLMEQPPHKSGEECTGIGKRDWVLFGFDILSTCWWLYSIILVFVRGTDATGPSVLFWWTAFRYTRVLYHHPIACRMNPEKRRIVLYGIAIVTVFVASGTAWVIWIKRYSLGSYDISHQPKYSCAKQYLPQSFTKDAAKNVSCSVSKICNDATFQWLYQDISYSGETTFEGISGRLESRETKHMYYIMLMLFVGMGAILVLCALVLELRRYFRHLRTPDLLSAFDIDAMMMGILFIITISHLIMLLRIFVVSKDGAPFAQEAYVTFDTHCRVAHVTMSRWKSYLDIDHSTWLRVVRLMFNA